jgi:hypothetical protein
MAKDKRSKDQKRKAKLAARARRKEATHVVEPYEGRKYQQDFWTPFVFATETAIYEVIRMTDSRLHNDTVQVALVRLVTDLRGGLSPTVAEAEAQQDLVIGQEAAFLMWNIRRHWTEFFASERKVAVPDLIGVLRTLLYSIEAHQWKTGRDRGYVAFLEGFMHRQGVETNVLHADQWALDDRSP